MVGAINELSDVELAEVEAAVGEQSFERGRTYARGNRVVAIKWDPGDEQLTGSVVGKGALYRTTAFFSPDQDGSVVFDEGECSCPVGYNCKHVAAIVIAATDRRGVAAPRPALRPVPGLVASPTARRGSAWEESLRGLVEAPAGHATGTPLAIELALQPGGLSGQGAPRLTARLMRPAARGGWINGSLMWSGLDSWHVQNGGHRPEHLALARELYAMHRARSGAGVYYGSYGGDRTLDLGDRSSPQLWSLLDEADRLGLAVIHARPGLGEVRRDERGELVIDVTRGGAAGAGGGGGGALVTATIRDRRRGRHGPRAGAVPRLARTRHRLRRPRRRRRRKESGELAPAARAARAAGGDPSCSGWSSTPHASRSRPASSSASPKSSAPACVMSRRSLVGRFVHAAGGLGPVARAAGELRRWRRPCGRARVGMGLQGRGEDTARPARRQRRSARVPRPHAERRILAATVLADTGLERFGLLDVSGRPDDAPVWLTGIDSMRLTTEDLPGSPSARTSPSRSSGEPPDYRDVGDSLAIGVSTADVAGDRDWFDLGVTISVEGRELPFAEVFTALARGESHMLLEDGAHFSLLLPAAPVAAPADRGGRGVDGRTVGAAADQPLPGRPVGGARRARRRDRAGTGVAAPGRRPARAGRGREPRTRRPR